MGQLRWLKREIVTPSGGRWWRFKYRSSGKERGLALGIHPEVLLKEARAKRDEAERQIGRGVDLKAERRIQRRARSTTFKVIAEEWLATRTERYAPATMSKTRWILWSPSSTPSSVIARSVRSPRPSSSRP